MTPLVCRCCGGRGLRLLVDLGMIPLANALEDAAGGATAPWHPIRVFVCDSCWLGQLEFIVPPAVSFSSYFYLTSASAPALSTSFSTLAKRLSGETLEPGDLIVDVGSNDGTLLSAYAEQGFRVLGIEPASEPAEVAVTRGVATWAELFSSTVAAEVVKHHGHAQIVHASNVLAHMPDVDDAAAGLAMVCGPTGTVVIETPWIGFLLRGCYFDTLYHEHAHHFSLKAIETILTRHGLAVHDVEHIVAHGGSLRVFASHRARVEPTLRVDRARRIEAAYRARNLVEPFQLRVDQIRDGFRKWVCEQERQGRPVVGYGAAAKATVALAYCGMDAARIAFVVDRSPFKQGRLVPGVRIPIVGMDEFRRAAPQASLVAFAWNLLGEVRRTLADEGAVPGRMAALVPNMRELAPRPIRRGATL